MPALVTADRLDPFVEPSLCVARLTEREEPAPVSRGRDPVAPPVPRGYVVSRNSPARTAAWPRFKSCHAAGSVRAVTGGAGTGP